MSESRPGKIDFTIPKLDDRLGAIVKSDDEGSGIEYIRIYTKSQLMVLTGSKDFAPQQDAPKQAWRRNIAKQHALLH